MNIEIANRLQQMRKKNNLSQEELAAKMGVTRQAVSKWERAESAPDMENLILLAKLYGVTIDELLNTAASPESVSAGISLKKDDYGYTDDPVREKRPENYTDEEIFPNTDMNGTNSIPQGAPFGVDIDEEEKKSAGASTDTAQDDIVKNLEKAGRAIGDVINSAGQKINEAVKNAEKADGKTEDWEVKLEREMEVWEVQLEKGMEKFGEKMGQFGKKMERKFGDKADGSSKFTAGDVAPKKHKEPATLLDKLFPLLMLMVFFVSIPFNLAHPGWTAFLLIPLYYTTKEAIRQKKIMMFCYPVFCVWFYLAVGGTLDVFMPRLADNWYGTMWLLFLTIPLFYTAYPAIKKRNPLIFCYPVLCLLVYIGVGIILAQIIQQIGEFWFATMWFPIFITIPIYYIVLTHYRNKKNS